MPDDNALTADDVAEQLRISKNMVYELRNRGELPGYLVGRKLRFTAADVQNYIDAQRDPLAFSNAGSTAPQRPSPLQTQPLLSGESSFAPRNHFVVNGSDPVIDLLSNYLVQMDIDMRRSYLTGYEGLISLYREEVDATSAHLWDGESDSYNAAYVKRLVPGVPCALIHIASRMQGFIVARGNPRNLRAWKDLLQPKLRMANHKKGSGARVLLDEQLKALGVDPYVIRGYTDEISSPILLTGRVARDRVDAVVGTEKMARQVFGVEFVPLHKERIDLVLRQRDLEKLPIRALTNVLESGLLRADITGFTGLTTTEMGRITLV